MSASLDATLSSKGASNAFLFVLLICFLCVNSGFSTPNVGVGKMVVTKDSELSIELQQPSSSSTAIPTSLEEEKAAFLPYNHRRTSSSTNTAACTTLTFEGSHSYDNELPPLPDDVTTPEQILSFFQDPKERDYLHKGGGNYIEDIPMTEELLQEWKAQAKIFQCAEEPTKDDPILAIHSSMSLLPGLSIRAVSYMGCRLMKHPGSSLPVYELTLIKDDFEPVGVKPLVWLVNQVAKGSIHDNNISNDNDKSKIDATNRKTHALTRISVHKRSSSSPDADDNNNNNSLFLRYYGHVKVACSIPRRLMKLMPMSSKAMEKTISKSIRKQIERESRMSLDPFRNGLEQFLLRQQQQQQQTQQQTQDQQ